MIITRDLGDIMDRWSIAKLKSERIGTEENKREYESFCLYIEEKKKQYPSFNIEGLGNILLSINKIIWKLEASMKCGKDILPNSCWLDDSLNDDILINIGKNSILIRDINNLRVGIKNMINNEVNEGFIDIKKNHMSGE